MDPTSRARDAVAAIAARDTSGDTPGRQRIMAAALALAAAVGGAGMTMRSIADAVNIKAGSIYSHFPDGKDELLRETLHWHYAAFLRSVLSDVSEGLSPSDELRAIVRGHVRFQLTEGSQSLFEILISADSAGHFLTSETRASVQQLRERYLDYVTSVVAQLADLPYPAMTAMATITLLNETASLHTRMRPDAPIDELIDSAYRMCLGMTLALDRRER